MSKFKYQRGSRFMELNHDDPIGRKQLVTLFKKHVEPNFTDHEKVGVDSEKQTVYHICYDCNIVLWNMIYKRMVRVAETCKVNLNWDEIKHLLRFSFIYMKAGGDLQPHTAFNLRALSAFNIPLLGTTEIDLYRYGDDDPRDLVHIARHEYTNPCFLDINQPHGVDNHRNEERLMLKTHLLSTPMSVLADSYQSPTLVSQFGNPAPWQDGREIGLFNFVKDKQPNS